MNEARKIIANELACQNSELFFTSGGTESDNWALCGSADALREKGNHIITSAIEHHAVLHTCEFLHRHGFDITYLSPDKDGRISPEAVERAIRPGTILISVMYANNEIGTLQPIRQIGEIARAHRVLFHTDAVQAFGHLSIHLDELPVDLLSASAHKLGGPKGVGLVYVRSLVPLNSYLHGGAQERGRRAGTENVAGIVGFGQAVKETAQKREQVNSKVLGLREHLIRRIETEIPGAYLNGSREFRLPGNVNIRLEGIEGESVLILLDMAGICASSGSACTSGSLDPSHVLRAVGLSDEEARSSVRLTLGEENTLEEIDRCAEELKTVVTRLRQMRG